VTYQPTQEQKVALTRGEMDIGLMLGPYQHSEFDIRSLKKDRLLVAMPGDHRLASKKRVPAAELRGEAMVLGTDRQWDIYRSRIEDALLANGVELQINCEASNILGMLGLVKMGLGVTIVPETMRDYCPRGITMPPLAGCDKTMETIAVWRKSARTKVKKFVKTLSAI
jgi:DNA-binding transcriptional LysR family regulator